MYVQDSLLAAAARTAEVSTLKQDLKRSEGELALPRGSSKRAKVRYTPVYIVKKKFGCKVIGSS